VIVTGRAYPAALEIWTSAQLSAPVISCGGALVLQPPTLKAIRRRDLPITAAATCVRLSVKLEVELSLWTDDVIWLSHHGAHANRLRELNHVELRRLAPGPEAPMPLGPKPVLKAMFGGTPTSLDRAQMQIAEALTGVEVTRAMPEFIDIVAHGSSKHDAIGDVLATLEVSPDQMIAIGDGDNDVGMLAMAAVAVVPANAMKSAKDVADLVIGHHDREGVASFLEDLLADRPRWG
jgi:Cof subfamily protein (haloacid dehalogenase superfamily)